MKQATYDPRSVQVIVTLPLYELSAKLAKVAQGVPLGGWAAEGLKKSIPPATDVLYRANPSILEIFR